MKCVAKWLIRFIGMMMPIFTASNSSWVGVCPGERVHIPYQGVGHAKGKGTHSYSPLLTPLKHVQLASRQVYWNAFFFLLSLSSHWVRNSFHEDIMDFLSQFEWALTVSTWKHFCNLWSAVHTFDILLQSTQPTLGPSWSDIWSHRNVQSCNG